MPDYIFPRERIVDAPFDGYWDIHNPGHQDTNGASISLAKDIEAALPGLDFVLRCSGQQCIVKFYQALDAAQEATLSVVVSAHKADSSGTEIEKPALRASWAILPGEVDAVASLETVGGVAVDLDRVLKYCGKQYLYVVLGAEVVGLGAKLCLCQNGVEIGPIVDLDEGNYVLSFKRRTQLTGDQIFSLRLELGTATSAKVRHGSLSLFELIKCG